MDQYFVGNNPIQTTMNFPVYQFNDFINQIEFIGRENSNKPEFLKLSIKWKDSFKIRGRVSKPYPYRYLDKYSSFAILGKEELAGLVMIEEDEFYKNLKEVNTSTPDGVKKYNAMRIARDLFYEIPVAVYHHIYHNPSTFVDFWKSYLGCQVSNAKLVPGFFDEYKKPGNKLWLTSNPFKDVANDTMIPVLKELVALYSTLDELSNFVQESDRGCFLGLNTYSGSNVTKLNRSPWKWVETDGLRKFVFTKFIQRIPTPTHTQKVDFKEYLQSYNNILNKEVRGTKVYSFSFDYLPSNVIFTNQRGNYCLGMNTGSKIDTVVFHEVANTVAISSGFLDQDVDDIAETTVLDYQPQDPASPEF